MEVKSCKCIAHITLIRMRCNFETRFEKKKKKKLMHTNQLHTHIYYMGWEWKRERYAQCFGAPIDGSTQLKDCTTILFIWIHKNPHIFIGSHKMQVLLANSMYNISWVFFFFVIIVVVIFFFLYVYEILS